MLRLLRLSYVPRWTIIAMGRQQSVAEHSYRVAVISAALARYLNLGEDQVSEAVNYAIIHDACEVETGDIPSTVAKPPGRETAWEFMGLQPPSDKIVSLVKWADVTEAITWFNKFGWDSLSKSAEVRIHLEDKWDKARFDLGTHFAPPAAVNGACHRVYAEITGGD